MILLRRRTPLPPMGASWPIRYAAYLQSPSWAVKRTVVLARAGHQCEVCGQTGRLEVHHLTYARCFREDISDLQAVCPTCHEIADVERRSRVADDAHRARKWKQKRTPKW